MRTKAAIDHYGSQTAVAKALGISISAVGQWGEIVPFHSATCIHEESGGKVALESDHYGSGGKRLVSEATAA